MKKDIIKVLIVALIMMIGWIFVCDYVLKPALNKFNKDYHQPDTIIIIHNGKTDTTITIEK